MTEKRMLIVPADIVNKINNNRGELSSGEFIDFLIENQLKKEETKEPQYATREEVHALEQDMKKLLKSFLDFFVNYGFEMGKESSGTELGELANSLQELQKDLDSDDEKRKATIKWK
ncbi:hypothetical protein ACFLWR_02850 [Chloroflexota bacterium]